MSSTQIPVAFVSGPLEPPPTYFSTHYEPRLLDAIKGCSRRVVVYLSTTDKRPTKGPFVKFTEIGGKVAVCGRNHTERDEAMTKASHYDILRYRTNEERRAEYGAKYRPRVSGTQLNERRRASGAGLQVVLTQTTTTVSTAAPETLNSALTASQTTVATLSVESRDTVDLAGTTVQVTSPEEKQLRGLRRKVREAEALVARRDAGERLEVNQLAKVDRLAELRLALAEAETDGHQNIASYKINRNVDCSRKDSLIK